MRGFRRRDDELHRLEAELRANRSEPPRGFIRALVESQRSQDRWLRPKVRVGFAVVLAGLALAAMASAGGLGVVAHSTKAAWKVVHRTTHPSPQRTVVNSPAAQQYKNHCGLIPAEPKCKITIFDASTKEPSTGTKLLTFTLSLDATNDAPVTVNYNTRDNTADSGACPTNDYVAQAGTVTFPAGSPSQTISIVICADSSPSGVTQETFFVDLSMPSSNADIYRSPATGTIST